MNNLYIISGIEKRINSKKGRTKHEKAVRLYANELLDNVKESDFNMNESDLMSADILMKVLLYGADNWEHYSFSGSSLCYDSDIRDRILTKSEIKKWADNLTSEALLNMQADCLKEACNLVFMAWHETINYVCISDCNSKMGPVPSVSFPAVVTCRKRCTCCKECYALKIERIYKTAREAYYRNLEVYRRNPAEFWNQVRNAMAKSDCFRFGVSGDCPDIEYFSGIVESCKVIPDCRVWMFTKQYEIVNSYMDNGGLIPENLTVIFSEWPDIELINPYNFPVAYVAFANGVCNAPYDAIECTGNCYECKTEKRACPYLKKGQSVKFKQH